MRSRTKPGILVKGRQQEHRHQNPGDRFSITHPQIPQAGCQQQCCQDLYDHLNTAGKNRSLAFSQPLQRVAVDKQNRQRIEEKHVDFKILPGRSDDLNFLRVHHQRQDQIDPPEGNQDAECRPHKTDRCAAMQSFTDPVELPRSQIL